MHQVKYLQFSGKKIKYLLKYLNFLILDNNKEVEIKKLKI